MAIEIEAKAYADFSRVRPLLAKMGAGRIRSVSKKDVYFVSPTDPIENQRIIRMRVEDLGTKVRLTAKRKTIVDGIETNKEIEFVGSDDRAAMQLLDYVGLTPFAVKRKVTEEWRYHPFVIELNEVEELGSFIEIEAVVPDTASERIVKSLRLEIIDIFDRLHIPRPHIEPTPYLELIRTALLEKKS